MPLATIRERLSQVYATARVSLEVRNQLCRVSDMMIAS